MRRVPPSVLFAGLLLAALSLAGAPARSAPSRDTYAALLQAESRAAGLPYAVADAVTAIESSYDPARIGSVGEIGLMQVRPATAAMLGFRGTPAELAAPAVNIHYGVRYLAEAWRRANGDLCRALMKYRAGHGQEAMSPLSATYCERARAHLAGLGSPLARGPAATVTPGLPTPGVPRTGMFRGFPAAARLPSATFWAAHEARVRAASARIERRWRRMAAR